MPALVKNAADVAAHDGEIIRAVGTYQVQNIAPRRVAREMPDGSVMQSSKVVGLELEDESRIRLWIRPDDEMAKLNGKRVMVIGTLRAKPPQPPPHVAAPNASPEILQITECAEYTD
jgi:hypothetical protein